MSEPVDHLLVDSSESLLDVLVKLLPVQLLHWTSDHPLVEVGFCYGPHLLDG